MLARDRCGARVCWPQRASCAWARARGEMSIRPCSGRGRMSLLTCMFSFCKQTWRFTDVDLEGHLVSQGCAALGTDSATRLLLWSVSAVPVLLWGGQQCGPCFCNLLHLFWDTSGSFSKLLLVQPLDGNGLAGLMRFPKVPDEKPKRGFLIENIWLNTWKPVCLLWNALSHN